MPFPFDEALRSARQMTSKSNQKEWRKMLIGAPAPVDNFIYRVYPPNGSLPRPENQEEADLLETDLKTYFTNKNHPNMIFPALEEVECGVRSLSAEIAKRYCYLHKLVCAHEDTIRRRWVKKSKKGREALLLQAFPNMSQVSSV